MYIQIYHFYRSALGRSIRLLLFVLLFAAILYSVAEREQSAAVQFLFNLFVMSEIFFHYKISRVLPSTILDKNKGKDMESSFTRQALYGFIIAPNTKVLIKKLFHYPQMKELMEKANIPPKDIEIKEVDKELLLKSAFDVAQTFKGKYVTTIDVFVAYLFLTEKDTKLLFAKQLKSEDIYNIAFWLRSKYPQEEEPRKNRVKFYGSGFGEALVSGWTPETKKYTANFTAYALREEPLLYGREAEFKTLLESLIKVTNNNVLIVGDIGAGKENLVRALAYHSFEGNLGAALDHKRVFQLLVGPLTAGVSDRGELEVRLQNIISEISHTNDVILSIPDFQNIVGASSYNLDISGALLPYVKSGNMPIVATITSGNYKTYMEHNPLKEAFNVIQLKQPEKEVAVQMVMGDAEQIEKKYKVIISYRSVQSAVDLAGRFLQDAALPGSAVALLETVANTVALSPTAQKFDHTKTKVVVEEDVVKQVEKTTHVSIGLPTGEEINLLLHLEDKLHQRVINQDEAISSISEAMRRVRSGTQTSERPISFLFLGPTGVGKTETAKALAALYYGGEKNMIRLDMSEYTDDAGVRRLLGSPPGQGDERGELTDKIHDNPSSIVLLDEFEKANPKIHNLFLQVLDDGRLTDNKGVTVSFRNAIIIATSNAGSEFVREALSKGEKIDKAFHQKLLDYLQKQAIFKPELLNRFDDVITFRPLDDSTVVQVVKLLLTQLEQTLTAQDISMVVDDAVIEKIAAEGFDKDFGARPLRRYIQDTIEDMIAQKKLTKELVRGKKAEFSLDGTGALILTIT
jgi:ATP-dependent Clp protease ATP-binding subunit ClpC